jgi:hypothetical protein
MELITKDGAIVGAEGSTGFHVGHCMNGGDVDVEASGDALKVRFRRAGCR